MGKIISEWAHCVPTCIPWELYENQCIGNIPFVPNVSLTEAPNFLKAPSGIPSNIASAIFRFENNTTFAVRLGDDEFNHMLLFYDFCKGMFCNVFVLVKERT